MNQPVAGRLLLLVGTAVAVVLLSGCPSATPNPTGKSGAAVGGSEDPAAVAALKNAKATLETDSEGRVVKVDLDSAVGSDADLEQIRKLPAVRELDCSEVRGVTDKGLAALKLHPALRVLKL